MLTPNTEVILINLYMVSYDKFMWSKIAHDSDYIMTFKLDNTLPFAV